MTDSEWNQAMSIDCSKKMESYLLNGLHCCGELAPTMIDVFCRLPSCRQLLLTSCCYHKMATGSQPMSERCRLLLHKRELRYVTLESACHFIDDYRCKLRLAAERRSTHSFQSQLFRAAYQELVARRGATDKLWGSRIGAGKCNSTGDGVDNCSIDDKFQRYTTQLLQRFNIAPNHLSLEESMLAHRRITEDWRQVVLFHCLRLMLGGAVETLLLVDRVLYLRENDIEADIYQIFDPTLSPRNSAIIATKRK